MKVSKNDEWIASKESDFFFQGIRIIILRWEKIVASDGAYFE